MRLHIISDLHLEFAAMDLPATDADVIVLAGDVAVGRDGLKWLRETFPTQPVIYVLGNHEFYHHSLPGLTDILKREAESTNIHLLENDAVKINGHTFLGCTLWTDFQMSPKPIAAMMTAEVTMADYNVIQFNPENRALRAHDTARLHSQSLAWLQVALSESERARTIVVTHHAPSSKSEDPQHVGGSLSPAFASKLDPLVEQSGVPLWIHGHTHYNVDYKLGRTRVLSNQRGYPEEPNIGFDPSLVVEL